MSRKGTFYIVAAPSGAGKTSLVKGLLASVEEIVLSISHTTRPMRPGDEDSLDYHFVSVDTFHDMVGQQLFLEHAEVFEHYYGTSRSAVLETINNGQDVVLEIDWQGARQIRQMFVEAVSIYILPPSMSELERRLFDRNQDSETVIVRRMEQAKAEMLHFHEFDYTVINDNFEQALSELQAIVVAHRQKTAQQVQIRQKLLAELTQSS